MYSKERDDSSELLVGVCGIDRVGGVVSGVDNTVVAGEEDATGAFRLKVNFALGIDAVRKSTKAVSSVFNCCTSIHSHLDVVEKLED